MLSATEDAPALYSAAQLLGNDVDADGNPLTIASVTAIGGGTAVLNADGTVRFTPTADFNGTAAFSYTVTDGTLTSAPAIAWVKVAPVNDAPRLGGSAAELPPGVEDTPYTFSAATLLAGYGDADGDMLSVRNLAVDQGRLQNNGNGTYTVLPPLNYNGPVSLTYEVSDGKGGVLAATRSYAIATLSRW